MATKKSSKPKAAKKVSNAKKPKVLKPKADKKPLVITEGATPREFMLSLRGKPAAERNQLRRQYAATVKANRLAKANITA